VRFGRSVPDGFLPVFSVDTEDEARRLIVMTCPRDPSGIYYARELAAEQSLENLQLLSDKLAKAYTMMKASKKRKP
jgi:hypothetical protein